MNARRAHAPRRAIDAIVIRRGSCALCGDLNQPVASVLYADPVCFLCALSVAQKIAAHKRANDRPHAPPCTCEDCITFDEGQRGEIANPVLLEEHSGARLALSAPHAAPSRPPRRRPPEPPESLGEGTVKRFGNLEAD
jgi:hypothetical protein